MVELAVAGNVQAAPEISDRVEGKPRQLVNMQQSPVIDVDAARERLYAAMLEAEGKDKRPHSDPGKNLPHTSTLGVACGTGAIYVFGECW